MYYTIQTHIYIRKSHFVNDHPDTIQLFRLIEFGTIVFVNLKWALTSKWCLTGVRSQVWSSDGVRWKKELPTHRYTVWICTLCALSAMLLKCSYYSYSRMRKVIWIIHQNWNVSYTHGYMRSQNSSESCLWTKL